MPRTYFADFAKDDNRLVTVEYSFAGGSETSYSPRFGADGGEGCDVQIVDVMPNTPEYDALCQRSLDLRTTPFGNARSPLLMDADMKDELTELDRQMALAKAAVALTDAEHERICDWLAEHHVDEPDEDDIF